DEQIAVDMHTGCPQGVHFLHEGEGIQHHAVADYAAASLAQHPAGNELKDEFLALNRDGVAGIVATRIPRNHVEAFRENVNDLAFTFVAPLRADDHRRLARFQLAAPSTMAATSSGQISAQLASFCELRPVFGEINMRRAVYL